MTRILCPTDFSSASLNALEYAARMGAALEASLTLLHVVTEHDLDHDLVETFQGNFGELQSDVEAKLKTLVQEVKQGKETQGLANCTYALKLGEVDQSIVDYASKHEMHLIVMGTTGASNLSEQYMGTNTMHVIGHTSCPVMSVPQKATYTSITGMLYGTDFHTQQDIAALQGVMTLALPLKATMNVTHIFHENGDEARREMAEFEQHVRSFITYQPMHFYANGHKHVPQGLVEALGHYNAQVLAVGMRRRNAFEKLFFPGTTKQLGYFHECPLLVFKLA